MKKEKLQSLCLRTLMETGPQTAHQIAKILKKQKYLVYGARQEVAPRLTELADKGRVYVVGKVWDGETKKNVSIYKVVEDE